MKINEVFKGDCLEIMKDIPDKSIDMICTDLPYGTTKNKWDSVIPFDKLWEQYERVIKDNGAILLFSSQPFTTDLINSNRKLYRYEIIWNKEYGTDFQLANKKPMKAHENIQVFYKKQPTYNPQKIKRDKVIDTTKWQQNKRNKNHDNFHSKENIKTKYEYKHPTTIFNYNMANGECNNSKRIHPTQKPVALIEWLIESYSNEGDVILDSCSGVSSSAIACINTNRNYICIEKDDEYYNKSVERISLHINK